MPSGSPPKPKPRAKRSQTQLPSLPHTPRDKSDEKSSIQMFDAESPVHKKNNDRRIKDYNKFIIKVCFELKFISILVVESEES